jgi:hypothetical protein
MLKKSIDELLLYLFPRVHRFLNRHSLEYVKAIYDSEPWLIMRRLNDWHPHGWHGINNNPYGYVNLEALRRVQFKK